MKWHRMNERLGAFFALTSCDIYILFIRVRLHVCLLVFVHFNLRLFFVCSTKSWINYEEIPCCYCFLFLPSSSVLQLNTLMWLSVFMQKSLPDLASVYCCFFPKEWFKFNFHIKPSNASLIKSACILHLKAIKLIATLSKKKMGTPLFVYGVHHVFTSFSLSLSLSPL